MDHKSAAVLDGFAWLQQAVANHYKGDPIGAGVVCAWLVGSRVWYVSVVRYPNVHSKEVICNARDTDMTKAMYKVAEQWMNQTAILATPRDQLQTWLNRESWLGR